MLGCIQWLLPIIAATLIFDSKFDSADHPAPSLGSIQILHTSVRARLRTETKVQELCPSSLGLFAKHQTVHCGGAMAYSASWFATADGIPSAAAALPGPVATSRGSTLTIARNSVSAAR